MKHVILLFVICWAFCGNIAFAQENEKEHEDQEQEEECKSLFTSEITNVTKSSDHSTKYTLKVSCKEEGEHRLSHITIVVPPCTKVTVHGKPTCREEDKEGEDDQDKEGEDQENDKEEEDWSPRVEYDSATGLTGFKIDELSDFGEDSKKSLELSFTLHDGDSSCQPHFCWKPIIAYESENEKCFKTDTLKAACPTLKVHLVKKNDTCFGSADGSLTVVVDQGTPPYLYTWSTGAITSSILNIGVGTYSVTIKDATSAQLSLTAAITQPDSIVVAAAITNATCNGQANGAINITVMGGTGKTYMYLWSNGAVTEDLASISSGSYSVTVTDSLGCQQVATYNVTNLKQLTITAITQLPDCNKSNGSIGVTISGGTSPYSFLWSNGATTSSLSNLATGAYYLTVTDSVGCTATDAYFLSENNTLAISYSVTPTACLTNSGAIDVTISGGTRPYLFSWSSGATTEDISQLAEGIYTLSVTDSLGCQTFASIVVFKTTFDVSAQITQPNCFGESTGAILLISSGGVAPYKYVWSTGATTSSVNNLADSTYTVTVTDSTGCAQTLAYTIAAPAALSAITTTSTISCNLFSIDLSVMGGTSPYQYVWSNGAVTQNITGVGAGTYTVNISDANGCKTNKTVTLDSAATWTCLIVPPAPTPVCLSPNNKIVTSVVGATSYQWQISSTDSSWTIQSGAANDTLVYVAGKKYSSATITLTITKNGCQQSCSYTIASCSSCSKDEDDGDDDNDDDDDCDEEDDDEDCDKCFSSSITKTSDSGTCATYSMKTLSEGCGHDLSHVEFDIPCGEVSDYSNTGQWPIALGKDAATGFTKLRVEKVSNFGKEKNSFDVQFSVCYSPTEEGRLKEWKPVVGYKTDRCHSQDSLSLSSDKLQAYVYPNPFSGSFSIDVACDKDEVITVDIFDSHGMKVCEPLQQSIHGGANNVIKIDGSHLRSDLYFYKVNTSKGSTSGKLIKTD
jgi:hypothetical protein